MLLMGRKYEITSFNTTAMSILEQLFPPTLEEWETSQAQVKNIVKQNQSFLFDLFNLVYEFPLPSIVRPLLISMCTIFTLVRWTGPITFIRNLPAIAQDIIKSGIPDHATLNPGAKQYCVLGRMILTQLVLQKFTRLYSGTDSINAPDIKYAIPTRNCDSRATCSTDMRDIIVGLVMVSGTKYAVSFLPPSTRPTAVHGSRLRLCSACFDQYKELKINARQDVWDELPGALKALDMQ